MNLLAIAAEGKRLILDSGANMPRAPEDVDRVSPGAHRHLRSRREAVLVREPRAVELVEQRSPGVGDPSLLRRPPLGRKVALGLPLDLERDDHGYEPTSFSLTLKAVPRCRVHGGGQQVVLLLYRAMSALHTRNRARATPLRSRMAPPEQMMLLRMLVIDAVGLSWRSVANAPVICGVA